MLPYYVKKKIGDVLLDTPRGGTGLAGVTTDSYLKGDGDNPLVERTPAEVRVDLGIGTIPIEVPIGGTGRTSVPLNSYIKGNNTGALIARTPEQVKEDLGITAPLLYKGAIDCSGDPNYPAADAGHTYVVSVTGLIGGAAGAVVVEGDLIVCNLDSSPSGDQATVGVNWNILEKNIDLTNIIITGGTIDGTDIGEDVPGYGAFDELEIVDESTPAYKLKLASDSDTPLTADRILTFNIQNINKTLIIPIVNGQVEVSAIMIADASGNVTGIGGTLSGFNIEVGAVNLPQDGGIVDLISQIVTSGSAIGTPHGWSSTIGDSKVIEVTAESDGAGSTQNPKVNIDGTVGATIFDTNVVTAGTTLSGTTLAADGTDADIDIDITPKGTGEVNLPKVDIDSGVIDNTDIGQTTAAKVKTTELKAVDTTTPAYNVELRSTSSAVLTADRILTFNIQNTSRTLIIPIIDGTCQASAIMIMDASGNVVGIGGTLSGFNVELDQLVLPENGGVVALITQSVTSASPDGTEHGWTSDGDGSETLRVTYESDAAGGIKNRKVTSTGRVIQTVTLSAATGDEVAHQINYTVNKAAGNDTGFEINMTDTASPGDSNLIVAKVGATTRFAVNSGGALSGLSRIDVGDYYATGSNSLRFVATINAAKSFQIDGRTDTASSGNRVGLELIKTYNQTGTAAATDILVNRTETAVGSGDQNLIDLQVGGSSKFKVDNAGTVTKTGAEINTPESITATSDGVAASLTTVGTHITTNGDEDLDNVTLANGTAGQIKHFAIKAVGHANDSVKITPATMVGGTQITFAASPLGLGCMMEYTSAGWVVIGNNGGTIA